MNSYLFGISGSWWIVGLLSLAAIFASLYYYRVTIPPTPPGRKRLLIALRAAAILLLLITVFEPVLTIISGTEREPKLAVLLDNSMSMAQRDAAVSRSSQYRDAFEKSGFIDLGTENLEIATFDSDVKYLNNLSASNFNYDSLKKNGQLTDISKALRWVNTSFNDENIQAILMFTDGEFNAGINPVYDADAIGKPVYIIGIGDSSEPKDIAIQSVLMNEIAYIDNPVPVNINVKINGYASGNLKLTLSGNGVKFAEQDFTISENVKVFSALMEYKPKTEGLHKITATISSLTGELTLKNNVFTEFIKVLKNKRKVAILAGAPGSDISFIKNVINKEKGVEISSFIQKKGAEFYDRPPTAADLSESEIIILIGFPISSTPQNVITALKSALDRGKSLFFVAAQNTDYNKLKAIEEYLPFRTTTSRPNEFLALPDFRQQSLASPLLRVTGTEKDLELWNQLPPLFKTETFVEAKPESEVLSYIKINNAPLKEPLIMTRSFRNQKTIAVMGYGLYRWKLVGYAQEIAKNRQETPDLLDYFINNSFRWLSVDQDNKNIRIKTTKKHYTSNENVEFIAQVYDASYTPVDNAIVAVNIKGGREIREINLSSLGNGRYHGSLEGMPGGQYSFNGDVTINNAKLGSDNGNFSVGEINLEFLNLRLNTALLRNLADRTGGKFIFAGDAATFLDELKSNPAFKPKAVTLRNEIAIWNLPYILGLSILLFAIEWFLRKKMGLL